jgi:hypothetical protein
MPYSVFVIAEGWSCWGSFLTANLRCENNLGFIEKAAQEIVRLFYFSSLIDITAP